MNRLIGFDPAGAPLKVITVGVKSSLCAKLQRDGFITSAKVVTFSFLGVCLQNLIYQQIFA